MKKQEFTNSAFQNHFLKLHKNAQKDLIKQLDLSDLTKYLKDCPKETLDNFNKLYKWMKDNQTK